VDSDLKPLAISKLIRVYEAQGNTAEAVAEAEKYRQQLKTEFPNWKAP
jgi:hypothetical protein